MIPIAQKHEAGDAAATAKPSPPALPMTSAGGLDQAPNDAAGGWLHGLQSRIVLFYVLLMLAVLVGGIAVSSSISRSIAQQVAGESLQAGARVFERVRALTDAQLAQSVRVLASDFAFRESVATKDSETLASVLANHGARIHADLMLLVGSDGLVIADGNGDRAGKQFALMHTLEQAKRNHDASTIALLDGKLYQLAVVPVEAPLPIAWVVLGYSVGDTLAKEIAALTGVEVSFISRWQAGHWEVMGTSLGLAETAALANVADSSRTIKAVPFKDDTYLSLALPQVDDAEQQVEVLLQMPLHRLLDPFSRLSGALIIIASIGLLITLGGSFVIARNITSPIRELAGFARRLAGGDYQLAPHAKRKDEIGALAGAFNHMRDEISARESRIANLAYKDPLTGLPNRALFNDRLQAALDLSHRLDAPLSVLLMDLDRFKDVNDTLGHHIGDLLLIEVAERLGTIAKRQSDMVARLGGDEFAIILMGTDAAGAITVAAQILQALEAPMLLEDQMVDIRASIGIAATPQHGRELALLLQRADVAMYLAKRQKSGFAIYDMKYDESSRDRLSMMSELRHAVERDELVLHYQPKIDLSGALDFNVEALIRWAHPTRGLLPPAEFLPFAEQTGFIKTLTSWVLARGIAQCAAWRASGLDVNVSMNICAVDLTNLDLPNYVARTLSQHSCRADWITLEIVESAILEDPDRAIGSLERLRALGCRLSIDDYGTGYSSLSYLKRLPVNELKIDRSFVSGMLSNASDAIIVKSTIDLGHNMGLQVVAEGVEDQATLVRLRELGCDWAQGYLISKPIAVQALVAWAGKRLRRPTMAIVNG